MRLSVSAVLLALALASCTTPPPTNPPPSPPTPPPAGGSACPAKIMIGPSNTYSVSSCTIKVGAEVTIEASGGHPLSGSGLKTISAAKSDQKLSFASAGKFDFACDFHGASGMTGTITVEP